MEAAIAEAARRAALAAAQKLQQNVPAQKLQQTVPKRSVSPIRKEPEKRKFTEEGPEEPIPKKKKSRWDKKEDAVVPDLPAPIQEVIEETQYLKKFDHGEEKDTYETAVETGGYIEGGTWEHRKRAQEMMATAIKSHEATELAEVRDSTVSGVGSYLPEEALKKFEQQQALARAQAAFKKQFAMNKAKKEEERYIFYTMIIR